MGRCSYSNRPILEHSAGISIQGLLDYGLLKTPSIATNTSNITSSRSGLLAFGTWTLHIENRETLSHRNYILFEYTYNKEKYAIKHLIETQPVHLGGYRFYFKCGCYKNGAYCGKRVKSLYFGGRVWACRHCLELVYQNCRYSRDIFRLQYKAMEFEKKAEKLRQFGHPRKANRLLAKAMAYERAFNLSFGGY